MPHSEALQADTASPNPPYSSDAPMLGVLGGMGPLASAWFMMRLTALTPARTEQEHIPALLWSDPRVPDRPAGWRGDGADPWPWIRHGLLSLERAGATAIAMPCNTAHLWYDKMCETTPLPVLHIVQAVVEDLSRKGLARSRIGLLGTAATLSLGLYQRALQARGYECLLLDDRDHDAYCARPIALVKANRIEEAQPLAEEAVERLRRRGADAVVLGCTELPLALPAARRDALVVPISDSIDALALAAIAWHAAVRQR